MPVQVERLTPQSSSGERSAAISETIRQLMDEGVPQEQAVAQANAMADKAMQLTPQAP